MRLIDADVFKDYMRSALGDMRHLFKDNGEWAEEVTEEFCKAIDEQPTIVEFEGDINKVIVKSEEYHRIVRCKNCKYYKKTSDGISYCYDHDDDILWQDDDYCSRGKRNETDNIR